jgi:hypothetical protein
MSDSGAGSLKVNAGSVGIRLRSYHPWSRLAWTNYRYTETYE